MSKVFLAVMAGLLLMSTSGICETMTPGSLPRKTWSLRGGYFFSEEKPALDMASPATVTTETGLNYFSSSSGKFELETEQEGFGFTLEFPKSEFWQWEISLGKTSCHVWIPSGPAANELATSSGWTLGAGLNVLIMPLTPVSPAVYSKFSWTLSRSRPKQIFYGGTNEWQFVENRWDVTTWGALFGAESSVWSDKLRPGAGFEIFQKRAQLRDLRSSSRAAGTVYGYRFFVDAFLKLSPSEGLRAEASLGDAKGYRLMLAQRF